MRIHESIQGGDPIAEVSRPGEAEWYHNQTITTSSAPFRAGGRNNEWGLRIFRIRKQKQQRKLFFVYISHLLIPSWRSTPQSTWRHSRRLFRDHKEILIPFATIDTTIDSKTLSRPQKHPHPFVAIDTTIELKTLSKTSTTTKPSSSLRDNRHHHRLEDILEDSSATTTTSSSSSTPQSPRKSDDSNKLFNIFIYEIKLIRRQ